ncbi:MAG: hypothetical protein NVSMB16_14830 [Acidimicrobiales bacterium]
MFVRMITVTGAKDIDAGVKFLGDTGVGELSSQKGFKGLTASADRKAGTVGVLGLWETLADLEASESGASKVRKEGLAIIGGTVQVKTMEQVDVATAGSRPKVGDPMYVERETMDPAIVDQVIAHFSTSVIPRMKETDGFKMCRHMIDRATGEGTVGVIFDDEAKLRAALEHADEWKAEAATHGVTLSGPSVREVVFSHIV